MFWVWLVSAVFVLGLLGWSLWMLSSMLIAEYRHRRFNREIEEHSRRVIEASEDGDELTAHYYFTLLMIAEPGKFSPEEQKAMRVAAYWTYRIMSSVEQGDTETAKFFHERLYKYTQRLESQGN